MTPVASHQASSDQFQQVQQGFQRLASQHASERFVKMKSAAVGDTTEAYLIPFLKDPRFCKLRFPVISPSSVRLERNL